MSTSPPPPTTMSKQEQEDLGILDFEVELEELGEKVAEKLYSDSSPPESPRHAIVVTRNWDRIWDSDFVHLFELTLATVVPFTRRGPKISDGGEVGIVVITMTTHFVDEEGRVI